MPIGRIGQDFIVDTTTTGEQGSADVTALAGGDFIVAWGSLDTDGGDIRGRIFNPDGSPLGNDFLVNSTTDQVQDLPALAPLPDGGFAVTWQSNDNGTDWDIRGRAFDADGTALNDDLVVNAITAGDQRLPAMTALADGGLVTVW